MPDDMQTRVAERAYQLWDEQGRPEGHDFANWLQAEREILGGTNDDGIAPSETDDTGAVQSSGDPRAGPNSEEPGKD